MSLTYSEDVGSLISGCVMRQLRSIGTESASEILTTGYHAFNIAVDPALTMNEFLFEVALAMGLKFSVNSETGVMAGTSTPTTSFYPSTTRGPIDTSSARQAFPWWQKTTVREAIRSSVSFLETAMQEGWNRADCEDVVKSLAEDLGISRNKRKRRALVKSLRAYYGKQVVRKRLWSRSR